MTIDDNNLFFSDSRPSRSDAVKNRELLLETAHKLFEDHGVESVSMTQIAQEAGVGKGTLYRHFNNKTDLCHALLDQDMRDLQDRTLKRLNTQHTPEEMLRWFLAEIARFVYRNNELLSIQSETERVSSLEFPAHLWWRQTIRGLLNRLDLSGDLDYNSDVLYVLLDASTIRFQRYSMNYDLDRIINGLHHTLTQLIGT